MIEREPVTIVVSEKGWIRALKGHVADLGSLGFKGDDSLKTSFFAETTSKILVLATNGKIFTLDASRLPGGRSAGEPIRLMADIEEGADIVTVFCSPAGAKMLVVASAMDAGFVVPQDELISSTRKGRALIGVDPPARASVIVPAEGDHVATIGENRKLLIFPLSQVPEMARGKGCAVAALQVATSPMHGVFKLADGLHVERSGGPAISRLDKAGLREWIGNRAEAGRLPPRGYPQHNRFGLYRGRRQRSLASKGDLSV